jgi:hypothetical protein
MDSTMKCVLHAILLSVLAVVPQAFADKLASVNLARMTHDSDLVFVGFVAKQDLVKDGLVVIDVDGMEKSLDVTITTFSIYETLKGSNAPAIYVCLLNRESAEVCRY